LHAADHHGYMPLLGGLSSVHDDRSPAIYNDPLKRKYTYYFDELMTSEGLTGVDVPAPLSAALGKYMNLSVDLSSRKKLLADFQDERIYRVFTCPSDANPPAPASTVSFDDSRRTPDEVTSYLFNWNFLGAGGGMDLARVAAGQVSKVRRPSEVFLFADGKRGSDPCVAYQVACYSDAFWYGTLFDYWSKGGGDPSGAPQHPKFDYGRHRKRANVAFVDGHVETIDLPNPVGGLAVVEDSYADFKRVGVGKGIYQ